MVFDLFSAINPFDPVWILFPLELDADVLQLLFALVGFYQLHLLHDNTLLRGVVIVEILLVLGFIAAEVSESVDA